MFSLCQFGIRAFQKSRPQRDSNPQSSDSKSDALSVGPCGLYSGGLEPLLSSVFRALHNIISSASSLWCFLPFHSRLLLSACFRCLCQLLDSGFAKKSRPQSDSNPQSSDSKSDALSVGPCGLYSGGLEPLLYLVFSALHNILGSASSL